METNNEKTAENLQEVKAAESNTPIKRNKYAVKEKGKKKKMPWWVKLIIFLVLLTALGIGIYLLIHNLLNRNTSNREITTAFSYKGQLETYINGWGTAAPKKKVDVAGKTLGKVTSVNVEAGDVVKAGDTLFVIDPAQSREKLDDALRKYDDAVKNLENVKKSIKDLNIYAPFSGRLLDVKELEGISSLSAGEEVCRLVDDSKMKLKLLYSYGYIGLIKEGMDALVSIPQSMSSLKGKVLSVNDVKINGAEGGIYFEALISVDNPGALTEDAVATAVIYGENGREFYPYDSGKLEFFRSEKLTVKTSGDIVSHKLRNGYECKENELILSLENSSLDVSLASAERDVKSAKESVDELREAVNSSVHKSPIDGVVTAAVVKVDDEITNLGSTLMTISDLSEMIININVDEMDIDKVSVGTPVTITVSQSEGERSVQGTVSNVSFEASAQNAGDVAYFPAQIIVPAEGIIMPGMGVNYQINSVLREDCVIVPPSAIVYTDEGPAVFVRKETADMYDEIIEVDEATAPKDFVAVPVEIGISNADSAEIISGISEDTEVYTRQENYPSYDGGLLGF